MLVKKLLIAILLLCFSSIIFAAEKIITVATLNNYSPYCFAKDSHSKRKVELIKPDADSKILQGYSWDVLRQSFQELGYTIKLSVYPWVRAMDYVKNGRIDILFPTGKNKEREKIFLYSKEPVNEAKFIIYVLPDSPVKWNGLESVNGLVIGEMRGWNYGEKWKANQSIKKHEIDSITQGFKMLDSKRLDGFAGYEVNFDYVLKQEGLKNPYKKLPAFDTSTEFVVGLKSNAHMTQILNDFDQGKRTIIENGKFDQIVKKWQ